MKGTLFSSDFIIDESDNLRLLEFNTDTGFLSSTLDSKFDFTAFINILSTNDITKLWIIHKGFQENFVEMLSNQQNWLNNLLKIANKSTKLFNK